MNEAVHWPDTTAGERRDPPTERVRIAGVEAAVAAGLAPHGPQVPGPDVADGGGDTTEVPAAATGETGAEQPAAGGVGPDQTAAGAGEEGRPADHPDGDVRVGEPEIVLPNWSDPPTGQVPRIFLDLDQADDTHGHSTDVPVVRGPVWREHRDDWSDEPDLSHLADEDAQIESGGGHVDDVDPFGFDFEDFERPSRRRDPAGEGTGTVPAVKAAAAAAAAAAAEALDPDERAWTAWAAPASTSEAAAAVPPAGEREAAPTGTTARRPRRSPFSISQMLPAPGGGNGRHSRTAKPAPAVAPLAPSPASPPAAEGGARPAARTGRNIGLATAVGVGIAALAVACFLGGSITTLALCMVVLTACTAEAYGALRKAGYKPAALVGILAVPAASLAGYLRGTEGVAVVMAAAVVATFVWFVAGVLKDDPVANIGATLLVIGWVGVLGSFTGLLLAPAIHPHGHGVAILFAAVLGAVLYDTGGLVVGSLVGRHKFGPRVSPNKTWEGLIGGMAFAIASAVVVGMLLSPWTVSRGILLGVVVAVFAPLGDLAESLTKRSLGIKDMGSLLPGHGGLLDRFDAILFVLPAAYVLVGAMHIS